MPMTASIRKVRPPGADSEDEEEEEETLAERLFDLSMDLSMAEPDDACQLALDLALEFVDSDAGSVVRGSINDPALTFVAATGPVRDQIIGRQVPFGAGLVGLAFDVGGTLVVNDASSDSRHLDKIDQETGFHTMASLCVPVLTDDGHSYGVIQLLNQSGKGFSEQDVEVVETIAGTLANALRAAMG